MSFHRITLHLSHGFPWQSMSQQSLPHSLFPFLMLLIPWLPSPVSVRGPETVLNEPKSCGLTSVCNTTTFKVNHKCLTETLSGPLHTYVSARKGIFTNHMYTKLLSCVFNDLSVNPGIIENYGEWNQCAPLVITDLHDWNVHLLLIF